MQIMKRQQARRSPAVAGFTLVEIMVVIAILGLLSTLVVTNVMDQNEYAKLQKGSADVSQVKSTVDSYTIRSVATELPTWEMLIKPDGRGTVWLPGFAQAPRDPWGNEYELRLGEHGLKDFEVLSWGPDGLSGTVDDISSNTIRDSGK